ncbi:MAG: ABC transporter permease subunit [Elusimicrobia bacterium]|nr:ABC transporter permease subunit [Elusimicrobiota bacterium]
MQTISAVFAYTLKEHVRHKAWLSSALFGLVLLGGSLIVSALGQDERARLMLDLGLAAIEVIALVGIVFLTVNLILQEVESRAIFLILTHPVRRADYLLGRFLGTVAAVALGMAGMALMHAAFLSLYGWWEPGRYAAALGCMLGKTAVMGALSLLLSIALTSEAAAMAFAVFLWTLGHFSSEMRFLADRSGSAFLKTAIVAFSHAAPDFARFNYRDFWHQTAPGGDWLAWTAVYALAYTAACLTLAVQLFEQKEF